MFYNYPIVSDLTLVQFHAFKSFAELSHETNNVATTAKLLCVFRHLLWCIRELSRECLNRCVGVHSTVVERLTYMRVYAGSSPTSADHRKELI